MKEVKKQREVINYNEITKNLRVTNATHKKVKEYCVTNDYWVGQFVEKVLHEYIDNQLKETNTNG